ncbi:hypothetical protein BOTBODRAFT_34569 [Botryobasidium botryosum FD-172 SS1]|uniref:Cytochrome P450 n=1 Tax=Botryobasidium botryosum (strain FD-172 SS1) TaxID=930990 RepID=A0A067ML53_BOTB1|nr:hypothetical protein BOTBODRAFT_34569 [Botryobasidium botryosum FD-172 SS1]
MLNAALGLLALFAASRIYKFWSGLKAVDYTPGIRCAFGARSLLGFLIPKRLGALFYNPGPNFLWEMKRSGGFEGDTDAISVVPWLHGDPAILISSLEMMQQVLGYSDEFDKFKNDSGAALFGLNVATLQREPWKKHRRVLNPAFSKKLYSLVWKESMRMFRDMVETEAWDKAGSATIPVVGDLTAKFTLNIVASCAFDFRSTWSDSISTAGTGMSLSKCLKVVIEDAPVRALAPKWAYFLPLKVLKRVDTAFTTLFAFLRAQVALRREKIASEEMTGDDKAGKNTIFSNIVRANIEGGKFAFDEDEVISNTFVMLFAGHETTARTLNGILALFGLYQDEQEKVYEEIKRVLSNGRDPEFEDSESFTYLRKCIQETMRLYPPVSVLLREAVRDVHLSVTKRATGEKSHDVVVKEGTHVLVNVVGIHYNPRHFPDPDSFKPSRWVDESLSSDAVFAGFGHGPRACIGRKFSLVEATCFLVMLLRDWRVDVDLAPGETPQEWQQRMMTDRITPARGLGPIPIRLSRRESR